MSDLRRFDSIERVVRDTRRRLADFESTTNARLATHVHPGDGGGGAVDSVNGETGTVVLDAADVGAQPLDSDLTTIAALAPADGAFMKRITGAWAASTLVKGDVGLGNVDNVSDVNKPVSTATQTALDLKLDISTADERARDAVGTALVEGTGIDITIDDAGNTITIAATGGGGGVTDHGALTGLADDDHTQYQLRSEKGAANGYPGLDATGDLSLATDTQFRATGSVTGTRAYQARLTGDTEDRALITANGTLFMGDGATTPDVSLFRAGVDQLRTNDTFRATALEYGTTDVATAIAAREVAANRGAANGYAPLNASADVPFTNLPIGRTPTTVPEGDHDHNRDVVGETRLAFVANNISVPGTAFVSSTLNFSVSANARYLYEAELFYVALAAADFRITTTGPSGYAGRIALHGLDPSLAAMTGGSQHGGETVGGTPSVGGIGATATLRAVVSASFTTAGTGGTFILSVAQVTSNATANQLLNHSNAKITRLA